ncbi:MAG: class I SAM-dependent methyltransferase [Candidatus Avelusimicrobium sp.]|uniref:class I SAM-dependent methyltransferase n=1 Tax=Candidatus Avelusimicrobium sp. TaxID=3048833 RepID=UPI003F00D8D4
MITKNNAKHNTPYRRPRKEARTMADVAFEAQKIAFAPISFQAALALRDLGILEYLNNTPSDDKTLAKKLKLSLYAVQTLLENGVALELVSQDENSLYSLTKTGWFLLCDPMTRANMDFINDVCYLGMHSLQESLKKGKPTGLKVFGKWKTVYEGLSKLPAKNRKSWFAFDHFYSDIAFAEILPLVFELSPKRIMDIGANTGKWAKKCLEYDKNVQMTLVDLAGQLNVAKKNLKKYGARAEFCAANVLDEKTVLPKGADAVLMSQFLDCFSEEQIVSVLKKVKTACGKNTRIYILEPLWDRQEYEAASFCLKHTSLYFTNIANGNSKMYSAAQMEACIKKAGLKVEKMFDGVGRFSYTLIRCVK